MRLLTLFLLILLTGCLSQKQEERPNILLINIDDMGWRDVGFMGSEYYETPVLDRLASRGMIFTQAYAAASNCAPSRASMMTGEWTPRHGVYTVGNSARGKTATRKLIPTENTLYISANQYILPEALRDAGYITCHAGKWHISQDPTTQGFDINIGGSAAGNPGSYYPPYKNVSLEAPADDYYLTNLIMDKTVEFIRSVEEDKQFFLYYSPYAVHTPIHPVNELLPKYNSKEPSNGQNNSKYATMVENLDIQIGRLLSAIEEIRKLNNTFILFTSDNGGLFQVTKQKPLRAGKGSYYEGGIREPMFVFWPSNIEERTRSDIPVTALDIYPTLLAVAGIEIPSTKNLDGANILPLLTGERTLKDRPLYWHFPIYLEGGNYESQDSVFRTRPGSAIRYGDWKLIEYFENGDLELYNLKDDIGEKKNLAESEPVKRNELKEMLEKWRHDVSAPVPSKLNPDFLFRQE